MRIANVGGRLNLVEGTLAVDVESASGGKFGADPAAVYARWEKFSAWAADQTVAQADGAATFDPNDLGAPSPSARQVFGIGLNYADHAAEAGLPIPGQPLVFTKFASCVTGPMTDVELVGDTVDWEAELEIVCRVRPYRACPGHPRRVRRPGPPAHLPCHHRRRRKHDDHAGRIHRPADLLDPRTDQPPL